MTEQQTDLQERELDYWMTRAYEAEGKLWKAEKRLAAWMEHWNATARTGAVDEVAAILEANTRADQAEARVRHLEAAARVLVKEVLDAENARDESRRGKVEAEARIKAVEDVLTTVEDGHSTDPVIRGMLPRMVNTDLIRRALESVPPPSA